MKGLTGIIGGIVCGISVANAAVIYQESVDGDFSDDYLNPTTMSLSSGDNTILGGLTGGGGDLDLFTVTVPTGFEVTGLRVNAFTGGGASGSFMGAQPFSILSQDPADYGDGSTPGLDPINYVIFGSSDAAINRDVLGNLVVGAPINGSFFDPKLSAGDYAFWLNETTAASTYTLTFEVTSIPEPATTILGLIGMMGVILRRVRR